MTWYVLRMDEKGQTPRQRHETETGARAEAGRLAIAYPGVRFAVVRLIASCAMDSVNWCNEDDKSDK